MKSKSNDIILQQLIYININWFDLKDQYTNLILKSSKRVQNSMRTAFANSNICSLCKIQKN